MLKHLTNTHDLKDEETAKLHIMARGVAEMSDPYWHEKAWQRHLNYLSDKIIGEPLSWHDHSDEELLAMVPLVPRGKLDGEGTLLEQIKRYVATTPTREELKAQGMVGVYAA
jgi:hypothetical protein